jgi:hypothetical protein
VRRKGDGFVIDLGADETTLVRRLVGELRALLADDDPEPDAAALLLRLFPAAYTDDAEREAEYQRLMREELVASKLASLTIVDDALAGNGRVDEAELVAFMQSVNSIRLVLGVMLDVTDDPDTDEVEAGLGDSPEHHLYGYLSWVLEWSVRALST